MTDTAHHTLKDSVHQQPESRLSKLEIKRDFRVNKHGGQRVGRIDDGGFWTPFNENSRRKRKIYGKSRGDGVNMACMC